MSRVARLLLVSLLALGPPACKRPSSSPTAAQPAPSHAGPASSAGAADDSKDALMRVAFPRWDGAHPWVLAVPGNDPKDGPAMVTVAATPQVVLPIDTTHRVLVVTDVPSDEDGNDLGAHASQGNLGAYWFTRQDGRWLVTTRGDSVMWGGVSGNVGMPKAVGLGGGHLAVAIDTGSCWQGYCTDWMSLIEFDIAGAHILVKDLHTMSSSTASSEACQDALAGVKDEKPDGDKAQDVDVVARVDADNCFDIAGKWRIQPRAAGDRGDLVVTYAGTDLVEAAGTKTMSPRTINETLVLRYVDGVFKPVSGKNPTHSL